MTAPVAVDDCRMCSGVARFVGTVPIGDEVAGIFASDDLELYHLDPPLRGYRIVAAAQFIYLRRLGRVGDPNPLPPEDPVSTCLYGTTGGEGLRIVWREELLSAAGRAPAWALDDAGYQVRR